MSERENVRATEELYLAFGRRDLPFMLYTCTRSRRMWTGSTPGQQTLGGVARAAPQAIYRLR